MNARPFRNRLAVPPPVLLALLGLELLVFACYRDIARHEFLNYDDNEYVSEHPVVRRGLHGEGVLWAFTHFHHATWHPLTTLSHMLDCSLFGLHAPAHLAVNLAFHLANTGLLFALLYRATHVPWASLWVAGAFALHPLHVESVVWVAERKDVLSTLFALLSSLAYVGWVSKPTHQRYAATLALFIFALLSKPMVVTVPIVWLLLDWWPLGRTNAAAAYSWRTWRPLVLEKWPFFLCAFVVGLVTIVTQYRAGALEPLATSPFTERVATAATALAAYLKAFVWPVGLAVFYPRHRIELVWLLGSSLLLVGLTALAFRHRNRAPYLLVGWLWYVVGILPVSGLLQAGDQARADRFTYVPLVGVFLALAFAVRNWASGQRWREGAALASAVGILVAWAWVTARQVTVWRTTETLFRHALRVTEANHVAHANLGADLLARGHLHEAREHLEAALRLRPALPLALISLGALEAQEGNFEAAAESYRRVLALRPDHVAAHFNLALVLRARGEYEAALHHVQRALEADPTHAKALVLLGDLRWQQGDAKAAIAAYERAVALRPDLAAAHNQLAMALEGTGRSQEALEFYRNVVRLAPDDPRSHFNLAAALKEAGYASEAQAGFRRALALAEAQGKPDIARAAREALAEPGSP